jgi:long-chain-fatty-acid--[acyl-carrier-protein] ligase
MEILGETIPEAFVTRALRSRKDVAAADDIAGVLTYERLLVGARVMAARFREFAEPNVGLLMPASVAADIALFGLHLAGKLPVVLNWTTGPNNLKHAVELMGLKRVVTSKAFIDRTHLEVPGVAFVFLEDIRKSVGKLELLSRLLGGRWFPSSAKRRALQHAVTDPNAPAVVLFTSGSEKAPKAVPLTHANVIANNRATAEFVQLSRTDSLLGFLPLFHSFGHTVAALLPLLSGIRLLHHPDPTDAAGLVRKVAGYKPTVICATPTFFGFILDRAEVGQLESLKCIVVGAERCPDGVFDKAKEMAPHGEILEGYGITECSPIVAANPPGATRRGTIGVPLPGVEVCVTELESHAKLPPGERGMMHVAGPNVFPGYLGSDAPSPFAEFDGKRWYVTGDLASISEDGYITFHGRLKRFLKAGGEMISLPALEEPFARKYPPTDDGPRVAVEGVELPHGGRKVVLFTTEGITDREANAVLQSEGFRGVMRLDEVQKVESIPVLGTGKTDYKALRAKLEG